MNCPHCGKMSGHWPDCSSITPCPDCGAEMAWPSYACPRCPGSSAIQAVDRLCAVLAGAKVSA